MDDDLAYCFGRFIGDQVELIDKRLEEIENEERTAYENIEKERKIYDDKRPVPKSKGLHHEDQALVDQFIQELRAAVQTKDTRTIIDDPTRIDTLRAETATKVNAAARYLVRIRNLARQMPNNASFIQACNENIDSFQKAQDFEGHFNGLLAALQQTDAGDVVPNVQAWWKNAYGSTLADLNRRNERFNKAATETGYITVSASSRIIDHSKKLIEARTIIIVPPPTRDIICKFVRRLLLLDEERRETVNEEVLVNQLFEGDPEEAIKYAQQWLAKRDEIRNQKEETNPCMYRDFASVIKYFVYNLDDIKMEAAKAEYGRQRIALAAKRIGVAVALCRLGAGSGKDQELNKQLKKIVNTQKDKNQDSLPVISGEIKEPESK
jgi:hypothetical protein